MKFSLTSLTLLFISTPVISISPPINLPIPAVALVSEAACIRSYSAKEHIACMKLVDSAILKAYWVGKMSQFCKSPFNRSAGKDRQCRVVTMLSGSLDEMSGRYLEE
ncbi:hypothetical protein B7R74_18825 [Yersinia pseudotuberculosis]|uniref:Uncharacterized protein n=2 Tax=Yersinia pseudotuberculosis complex TaxID=1649845 RepID=A0A0T9J9T9_YERPU|nr:MULTISPECIES: hypothetical protein [Yersinia pseudotuberculosis complex]PSH14045.1 hypothetical protein B7R74_18825 [Yersinia pseudotuberculosis]CNC12719.1 Uncharacterised protein [Yersinia pseudotuberculosis]CRG48731.1 Uncharacterised protein [Yersinia wautersii]SUP81776.1 Uncharacterised protein [Yersinia pseudotuberculosis]